MTVDRMKLWESLFQRALAILDHACKSGMPDDWSFGGGTVLMLKHRHRFSKDVDIFVPDPQCLGFLTPRLNDQAEVSTHGYDEQANSLKIYYAEGEVDFVAAGPITAEPFEQRVIRGRLISVETPTEIVAKKLKFRAADFKARDIFDLALVLEREPLSRPTLTALLRQQEDVLRERFRTHDPYLREDFAAIDTLEFNPSFDSCLRLIDEAWSVEK